MKGGLEMKKRNTAAMGRTTLLLSSVIVHLALFVFHFSADATPAAASPYTFIGRVMDASHKAFDANRKAKVEAYNGDGERLSSATTFFREGSRRNYSLVVPMATAAAAGYAVQDDALEITATDDVGKTWRGVVVGATAGAPGAVREVDIVLGEDANGDGIDDSL